MQGKIRPGINKSHQMAVAKQLPVQLFGENVLRHPSHGEMQMQGYSTLLPEFFQGPHHLACNYPPADTYLFPGLQVTIHGVQDTTGHHKLRMPDIQRPGQEIPIKPNNPAWKNRWDSQSAGKIPTLSVSVMESNKIDSFMGRNAFFPLSPP